MYIFNIGGEDKTFLHMVKTAGISVSSGLAEAGHQKFVNLRHMDISYMPVKFKNSKKYIVLRKPHEWYISFYNFFVNVEGYLSFMLNDPKDDGYIYPIGLNEFIRRSINFKDTLEKFPNKARVFNNILQTQGNIHFITTYFEEPIDYKNNETLKQFDMSLFEWFWRHTGGDEADVVVPMNRLDFLEEEFQISISHANKTKNKKEIDIDEDVLDLIKSSHKKFYDMYEELEKELIST